MIGHGASNGGRPAEGKESEISDSLPMAMSRLQCINRWRGLSGPQPPVQHQLREYLARPVDYARCPRRRSRSAEICHDRQDGSARTGTEAARTALQAGSSRDRLQEAAERRAQKMVLPIGAEVRVSPPTEVDAMLNPMLSLPFPLSPCPPRSTAPTTTRSNDGRSPKS